MAVVCLPALLVSSEPTDVALLVTLVASTALALLLKNV